MLLPGFVEYGRSLGGSTFAAGVAFGAYPLALALFMFPLGALSDRFGRRVVMIGALGVSAVGGALAAFAPSVVLLALARFVQGSGAVNAVAVASAAEAGDPARRTRRMALLGAAAGIGFAAGLVLGALLIPLVGVPGVLLLHSAATLLQLPMLARLMPRDVPHASARAEPRASLPRGAWLLAFAGLALNLSMTGLLFLSPLLVASAAPTTPYALVVVLMVLPGGVGMFLSARLVDRGHARLVGIAAALLLALGPLPFLDEPPIVVLVGAGVLYFIGHASLSSLLPSLAGALAARGSGGRVQGMLSTLQYVGSFGGASIAGALYPSAPALAAFFLGAAAFLGVAVAGAARA